MNIKTLQLLPTRLLYAIILLLTLQPFCSRSQNSLNIDISSSALSVLGTSSLHDWESQVSLAECELKMFITGTKPLNLTSVLVDIPVSSIKSGKNLMDKKTYQALKSEDHPIITYRAQNFRVEKNTIIANGLVTVAGVSKKLPVEATYQFDTDTKQLTLQGKATLNMSDFNVRPPTALMGSIKTGDEITIKFNLYTYQ